MRNDQSSIRSTFVSMQSAMPASMNAAPVQGEPWNILIFGDFGFASQRPERVHVSEWNDLMARCSVTLAGNVPDCLSGQEKAAFVEYRVASMRDFSAAAIKKHASILAPYDTAITAVGDLLAGKIDAPRAAALIEQTSMYSGDKRAMLALLGKTTAPQQSVPTPPLHRNSGIDSVLAMMDIPTTGGGPMADATDALASAVTDGGAAILPHRELEREKMRLEEAVDRQAEAIMRAPFFAQRRSSWTCLKLVASALGRTKGVTVNVFSCDREALADAFAPALQSAAEQGFPPDIVLIDAEFGFSNADIARLETMAEAASDRMCSIVASLDPEDPLFDDIASRDTLVQFFDDARFLPFKKLRSNPAARTLALCGPTISVGEEDPVTARGGWRVLFAWIDAFLADRTLFACDQVEHVSFAPISCTINVPGPIVADAVSWGLTLFGSGVSAPVVTVMDEHAANPAYTRFGYTLAVHRIVSMVVRRIGKEGERCAETVRAHLVGQLRRSSLIASDHEVSVEADDQDRMRVVVDSETTVCGFPLQVEFSL